MSDSPVPAPSESIARRRRLSDDRRFLPWTRAQNLKDCSLFWMPVSGFPLRFEEKHWLTSFLERLSSSLESTHDLRTEMFLRYKAISADRIEEFMKYRMKCMTMMGLGRHPDAALPALPTGDQLREIVRNGKPFDLKEWIGDFQYWFAMKQPERQRELYLGTGGLTTIFLPPDPGTKPPKLPFTPKLRAAHPTFQRFDVDAAHASTYAMSDAFLAKSKTMFGTGLEDRAHYEGLAFILPLLDSGHFFAVTPEVRAQWFELFDVYVNESLTDKGIVLAFAKDFEPLLLTILDQMELEKFRYPLDSQ